jgi:hypothetical protein
LALSDSSRTGATTFFSAFCNFARGQKYEPDAQRFVSAVACFVSSLLPGSTACLFFALLPHQISRKSSAEGDHFLNAFKVFVFEE